MAPRRSIVSPATRTGRGVATCHANIAADSPASPARAAIGTHPGPGARPWGPFSDGDRPGKRP